MDIWIKPKFYYFIATFTSFIACKSFGFYISTGFTHLETENILCSPLQSGSISVRSVGDKIPKFCHFIGGAHTDIQRAKNGPGSSGSF